MSVLLSITIFLNCLAWVTSAAATGGLLGSTPACEIVCLKTPTSDPCRAYASDEKEYKWYDGYVDTKGDRFRFKEDSKAQTKEAGNPDELLTVVYRNSMLLLTAPDAHLSEHEDANFFFFRYVLKSDNPPELLTTWVYLKVKKGGNTFCQAPEELDFYNRLQSIQIAGRARL
ncbi:hypothetical protein CBS101457_004981 [Exobasidium rhododendri]|nr:hypothetical protein CBS101457_004981 [Exobasidium rhododendri]